MVGCEKEVIGGRKLHSWCFMLKWHSSFNTIRKRLLFLKESGPDTGKGGEMRGQFSQRNNRDIAGTIFLNTYNTYFMGLKRAWP